MGISIDLANAVVTALNDWSWGLEFTAQRVYQPRRELEEVGEALTVDVGPRGQRPRQGEQTTKTFGRVLRCRYYEVDILVAQRIAVDDLEAVDPLTNLTDEIADYFENKELTVTGAQVRVTNVTEILADGEDFNRGQFSSLVRLVCQVIQQL